MKKRILLSLPVAALIFIAGCGPVTNPPETLNPGALTVDVSDAVSSLRAFNATDASARGNSVFTVHASDQRGNDITLTIPGSSTTPYTVTSGSNEVDIIYFDPVTQQTYDANTAQGSCTVTITSVTSTQLQGTFSARAICSSISDSVRSLTSGSFNATFQ